MIKVGKKYIIKNSPDNEELRNKECEIVEIVNKETVIVGFNNAFGWGHDFFRKKTGYKFFWAVNVEYLEYENLLEIE